MTAPADQPRPTPSPPARARAAGRRYWEAVTSAYDLADHELSMLGEITRMIDHAAALDALVWAEGHTLDSPQGRKSHPALVEARHHRETIARLVRALALPNLDADQAQQPPARRPHRANPYSSADGGRGGGQRVMGVAEWRRRGGTA